MRKKINLDEVRDFIESTSQSTKIYIGSDSERHKRGGVWFSDTATVVVVLANGDKAERQNVNVCELTDWWIYE